MAGRRGGVLWVLYRLVRPLHPVEAALLLVLIAVFVVVLALPWTNELYAFEWPPARDLSAVLAVTVGGPSRWRRSSAPSSGGTRGAAGRAWTSPGGRSSMGRETPQGRLQ